MKTQVPTMTPMMRHVILFCSQDKIARSVVMLDLIFVMDNFVRRNVSAKDFLHHQDVLVNLTCRIGSGMILIPRDSDIAIGIHEPATLPGRLCPKFPIHTFPAYPTKSRIFV